MSTNETYSGTEWLLQQMAHGDEKAFTTLFYRFKDKIYSVAIKMTESNAMAEEIVQDVFLKIWLKREELSDVQSFEAYLVTAARNKTYDYLRSLASQKDNLTKLKSQALARQETTEDWMTSKDYQRILKQGIDLLPPQQQKVFLLSREEGLKRDEIAERLGISPETVKIHLGNANKKLRAYCMARLDLGIIFLLVIKNIL